MISITQLSEIARALEGSGLIQNVKRLPSRDNSNVDGIEGTIEIDSQEVSISLQFPSNFPRVLPLVFIKPWDALGFIPHVNPDGIVCFLDTEGIILNQDEPSAIVIDAVERAIQVLKDGLAKRNQQDFVEEFEAIWSWLTDYVGIFSLIEPSNNVMEVVTAFDYKSGRYFLAESEQKLRNYFNSMGNWRLSVEKALYIPMRENTLLIPPRPDKVVWDAEEVRQMILPNVSNQHLKQINKRLSGSNVKYIVARLPRFSEGDNLFGFKFEGFESPHPLLDGGKARSIKPLRLHRQNRSYLVKRGGGTDMLSETRALLVGCGAIGGHLAFELARAGISNITLVDPDKLTPDNTFRHTLGMRYWGQQKTTAIKQELESNFPQMKVRSFPRQIEHLLRERRLELKDFDIVVLATGNPTIELYINEIIHRQALAPVVLVTWLEPLGIGGHVLLCNNTPDGGCLECVYTQSSGENKLVNRAAFAAEGQSFGKALSGCGSLHTPYGSVDAIRTVSMAVKLAIDALLGREMGNPLISWKGSSEVFLTEGFLLSTRFDTPDNELFQQRYAYKTSMCPVCGHRI